MDVSLNVYRSSVVSLEGVHCFSSGIIMCDFISGYSLVKLYIGSNRIHFFTSVFMNH